MEFLCILQPQRGLVPPRVVGSNHLLSYGRGGGLRTETSSAMFSTGTGRGRGKGKDKVFGKWRLENVQAETLLYFFFFVIVHVWWRHVTTFLFFCYCVKLYIVKLFCYCLSGDRYCKVILLLCKEHITRQHYILHKQGNITHYINKAACSIQITRSYYIKNTLHKQGSIT